MAHTGSGSNPNRRSRDVGSGSCAITATLDLQKSPCPFHKSTRHPARGILSLRENVIEAPDLLRNIVPGPEHLGYSENNKEIGF
jgi:hypothetical protein